MSETETPTVEVPAASTAPVEPAPVSTDVKTTETITPDLAKADTTVTTDNAPDFRSQLSDEFRDHSDLKDLESVNALAKALVNSRQLIGKDKLVLPGENATQEQLDVFYSAIGRPDKSEDYQFKTTEGLPDGITSNEEQLKKYADHAHKIGLTRQQAAAEIKFHEEQTVSMKEGYDKLITDQMKENETSLRNEFGNAYDGNVALAGRAMDRLSESDAEFKDRLTATGIGSDPSFVKMMVRIGKMMGESSLVGHGEPNIPNTPDIAAAKIAKLHADPEFMKQYMNKMNPNHKSALDQMRILRVEEAGNNNITYESSSPQRISSA